MQSEDPERTAVYAVLRLFHWHIFPADCARVGAAEDFELLSTVVNLQFMTPDKRKRAYFEQFESRRLLRGCAEADRDMPWVSTSSPDDLLNRILSKIREMVEQHLSKTSKRTEVRSYSTPSHPKGQAYLAAVAEFRVQRPRGYSLMPTFGYAVPKADARDRLQ